MSGGGDARFYVPPNGCNDRMRRSNLQDRRGMDGMEHARSDGLPAARNPFVIQGRAHAWPFQSWHAASAARPGLDRAALEVLAATARAWGLPERAPPAGRRG
jgi:hypothetical protein